MRILVIADIHGEFEKVSNMIDKVDKNIGIIICPGDFTDMFNIPQGFSQNNVADLVIQKLLVLGKPLLCVPGNHDPYDILDVFDEYKINLHNKIRKFGGLDFVGWGGAPTPFNTLFEPTEEETTESLERLGKKTDNFILVLHNPPKNTKLDLLPSGQHVGSKAAREFILKKKPILVVSAHIHEASGTDKLGDSVLFYPGEATKGCYGIVTIVDKKVTCEIKKI